MSEEILSTPVQSPPLSATPLAEPLPDPRQALHRLAQQLMRSQNRKLLAEFLQLRRALR
jgi:hypothetical protein